VLSSFLVDICLSVVGLLINLVTDHVAGGLGTGAEGSMAVFGDVLVGLLRGRRAGTLDGFGDVVGGVPAGGG
jgi:hypothetical protein